MLFEILSNPFLNYVSDKLDLFLVKLCGFTFDFCFAVQSQKGVLKALLVTEEGTVAASSLQDDDIDQLGVLANLQALTGLCTDVSKYLSHTIIDSMKWLLN